MVEKSNFLLSRMTTADKQFRIDGQWARGKVRACRQQNQSRAQTSVSNALDSVNQARVFESFGKLPMYFIEDRGGIDPQMALC